MALALGEAILAAEPRGGGAIVEAICNTMKGAIIGKGVVRRKSIAYTREAFDVGTLEIASGDDRFVLHVMKAENRIVTNWLRLARERVPFQGLPSRIAWLGHGDRTALGLAVNRMVRDGMLSAPVAFTRDHLDAGAMAHPNIMTENMRDGSDAVADWPLINALVNCASQADLVAIHSGGGGYAGYMTSSGVTLIADGSAAADERLNLTLTNDTTTGVMRYADASYEDSLDEIKRKNIRHFRLDVR